MKLFISVDMEGTTGLERLEEIFGGLPGFDVFRQLMAGAYRTCTASSWRFMGGDIENLIGDVAKPAYACRISARSSATTIR